MAKPFKMSIVPEVRQFISGMDDVIGVIDEAGDSMEELGRLDVEPLADLEDDARNAERAVERAADNMGDAVEGIGDEARDAGRKLGDEIDDGAKEAEDAVNRFERAVRDSLSETRPHAKKAGDDISREVKRGAKEAESGLDEFKDEAGSSGREAAASFGGGFDDIQDLVQETAANAFAGFGPLGAAAGIAAAVGIGFVTAEIEKSKERAQETAEEVSGLADEMIELGSTRRGAQEIEEALREAATTAEDGTNKLESWADMANRAGIDGADFARAMAGDMEAAARIQEELAESQREVEQAYIDQQEQAAATGTAWHGLGGDAAVLEGGVMDVNNALAEQYGATEDAANIFNLYEEALDDGTEAAARHAEQAQALAESIADYIGSAGEDWQQYFEEGEGGLDAYNESIEEHRLAVENFQRNMAIVSSQLSEEALNYIRELGPEAAPLLQEFIDAPLDQQERTAANWDYLGRLTSESFEGGVDLTGPIAREISAAGGYADRNPISIPLTVNAGNLGAQVGYAAARIKPPAIQIPVIGKAVR